MSLPVTCPGFLPPCRKTNGAREEIHGIRGRERQIGRKERMSRPGRRALARAKINSPTSQFSHTSLAIDERRETRGGKVAESRGLADSRSEPIISLAHIKSLHPFYIVEKRKRKQREKKIRYRRRAKRTSFSILIASQTGEGRGGEHIDVPCRPRKIVATILQPRDVGAKAIVEHSRKLRNPAPDG